jgi:hypothetical protein
MKEGTFKKDKRSKAKQRTRRSSRRSKKKQTTIKLNSI